MKTTNPRGGAARAIGVRDAKAHLSRLLQDVQRGIEWTITERGKPIARLVPIVVEPSSLDVRMRRLEENGTIEPAPEERLPLPHPLPLESGLAQRMLDEERSYRA
jgi:prevent-host-death family protein